MQRPLIALAALVACLVALPATAAATSTPAQVEAAESAAVEYLRGQQDPVTGELAGYDHGSFSSDLAVTALAAAGVSSADVRVSPDSPSLQDFLLGDYVSFWSGDPVSAVTNYERVTMVSHAAGLDPARLAADLNLPAQIAGVWNPIAGTFGSVPSTNSTAFGIMALKTAPVPNWTLAPAISYLRQSQHDDGGWNFGAATTPAEKAQPSDPDMTGAAIAALCETGAPAYDPDVAPALAYLQRLLVNADTTAWVVSGLNACGIDPQSAAWTTSAGRTPIDHLLSLQVPSGPDTGGFGYDSPASVNLYSTQDALRAIAGAAFTAPAPVRRDPSQPRIHPVPVVAPGTPVPHLLAIGLAPGNVRICHVRAPEGAPLTQVLSEARAESFPAGCVTSFSVSGGQIESINGFAPANQDEAWLLRLDRGAETLAADQPVGFGEVVSLRLGERPSGSQSSAGPAGSAGKAGNRGRRGKRGPKGRPGRNSHIRCKVRHRRSGKRGVRCSIKHPR